jgi:hypothetical protein
MRQGAATHMQGSCKLGLSIAHFFSDSLNLLSSDYKLLFREHKLKIISSKLKLEITNRFTETPSRPLQNAAGYGAA